MCRSIPESLLYSVGRAAAIAGVSPAVIRRLIDEGDIPIVRVGLLVRIRREDLAAWSRSHTASGEVSA